MMMPSAAVSSVISLLPRGVGDRRAAVAAYRTFFQGNAERRIQALVGAATLELDLADWPQAQAFLLRRYDPETVRFICDRARPGGVFFDGGAHVGLITCQVAAERPDLSVHAFEPHPGKYRCLRDNIAGSAGQVTAVNVGLSDHTGESAYSAEHHAIQPEAHTSIRVKTIDEYAIERGIEIIDVLKLDIEGHELRALSGAVRMLEESRIRVVTLETMHGDTNAPAEFLRRFGFRPVSLPDLRPGWVARLRPHVEPENAGYVLADGGQV